MNAWLGIGRLTRDPERRSTGSGEVVAAFSLAVDIGTKSQPKTLFADCSAFGKTATIILDYVTKGQQLGVQSRLDEQHWIDKTTGLKRSKICMIVERVTLIGSKGDGGNRSRDEQQSPEESSQVPPESHDVPYSGRPAEDVPF